MTQKEKSFEFFFKPIPLLLPGIFLVEEEVQMYIYLLFPSKLRYVPKCVYVLHTIC